MEWEKLLCVEPISGKPRTRSPHDLRSEFEKDYDRTVFSTPVRRLQDKAQVFVLEPHDAVRTRLTHSLEVSTVAKDLTHAAAKWMVRNPKIGISADEASYVETIAATCGLIHDLGNPPFGHAGESAIASWFQKRQTTFGLFNFKNYKGPARKTQLAEDFLSFEGNAQTIRLLTKLQILVNFHGLNLTLGTLSAACKYTAASDQADSESEIHEHHKPGFFTSENALIERVRTQTGTGESRNPITFLVEAADDIVYSTVDIEDAIKKDIIDWAFVEEQLRKSAPDVYAAVEKRMTNYLKGAAIELKGKNGAEARSQTFRIFAISLLVPSVVEAFQAKYEQIMEGKYHGELVNDCSAKTLVKACKTIGRKYIYCSSAKTQLEVMGREIIFDLMDIFWEGASCAGAKGKNTEIPNKILSLMSENYRTVFEQAKRNKALPEQYCQMQLVTDYICGMTDGFARTLHRQLKNG
jgi:dGTPase